MKGSIEQRGSDKWRVRIRGGVDGETGKRRVQRATVRGKRRDARRKLNEMLARSTLALTSSPRNSPSPSTAGHGCGNGSIVEPSARRLPSVTRSGWKASSSPTWGTGHCTR